MTEETKTYLVKKQMERWCEKNKIFDKFNDVILYGKTLRVNNKTSEIEVI